MKSNTLGGFFILLGLLLMELYMVTKFKTFLLMGVIFDLVGLTLWKFSKRVIHFYPPLKGER
jgi:uncharacterized membrane protein YccF (DUF307 family)